MNLTLLVLPLPLLLLILAVILLARTLAFRPKPSKRAVLPDFKVDRQRFLENFPKLLQCKTVSSRDPEHVDRAEFRRFAGLLPELYPRIHSRCERQSIGPTGLLYRWPGKNRERPVVLMSHYDVVPADPEFWTKDPFAGLIQDGHIWGRGTLDTKSTLCALLEAAESLAAADFVPEQDIYFSFSGDEEIGGPSAPAIVEYLKDHGIAPVLVLDEGGAIVNDIFPGVKHPVAVVGTGEKGYMDITLELQGPGGHSSTPPAHSLAGIMAAIIVRIENHPFPARFTRPVLQMFDTLGRHCGFGLRLVFANLWLFKPLLARLFRAKGGQLDAMIRTSTAVTRLSGSPAFNVLPPRVTAGINYRLLDDADDGIITERLKRQANCDKLQLNVVEYRAASPHADMRSPGWQLVEKAIGATWPEVVVSPYLMLAGTDSRHFCAISDCVLRFSAMKLSKADLEMIHGHDERITIEHMEETVRFYGNLIRLL